MKKLFTLLFTAVLAFSFVMPVVAQEAAPKEAAPAKSEKKEKKAEAKKAKKEKKEKKELKEKKEASKS